MVERNILGALREDVANLRREVGALTAGIEQLVAGQGAHTTLLTDLLSAVTELSEDDGEGGLGEALGRIVDSLDAQGETLAGMRSGLDAIPAAVATALGSVRAA